MGIYRRWIFPRLVRWGMSHSVVREQRRLVLTGAYGKVLEIGFGPGLNIPFYPSSIAGLVGIDPNPGMIGLVDRVGPPLAVETILAAGENLPFSGSRFDCVVSTWTLCSIVGVERALGEVVRVLRPGGLLLFVEHGLSWKTREQRWQNLLTPIQKRIADGCHLNRNIPALIAAAGLEIVELEQFYLPKTPRLVGSSFRGKARKAADPAHPHPD